VSDISSTPAEDYRHYNPFHESVFEQRAINPRVARLAGIEAIDLGKLKDFAREYRLPPKWPGLPLPRGATGLRIPNPQVGSDTTKRGRVRLDETEVELPGPIPGAEHHGGTHVTLPRYLAQAGLPVAPYLLECVQAVSRVASVPLWIVEAPLKALSLVSHYLPAIGLGGVLAGAHDPEARREHEEICAHPHLLQIDWRSRLTYVAFDAGLWASRTGPANPLVALGAAYVWRSLGKVGADVRLVKIPYQNAEQWNESDPGLPPGPTDQGPDDFIYRHGIEAFSRLAVSAIPADPKVRLRAIVTSSFTKEERAALVADLLGEAYYRASLHVLDRAELQAIASIARSVMGVRAFQEAVSKFRENLSDKAKEGENEIYSEAGNCTFYGEREVARFTARIDEQVTRDDGQVREKVFRISGRGKDGTVLPQIEVSASKYHDLDWVVEGWGNRAILGAEKGAWAHAATAIQVLSTPKESEVYTSIGWKDGTYLMPGTSVSAEGNKDIEVEPGDTLSDYDWSGIDLSDEAIREGVKLSLSILDAGDRIATVCVLGATYGGPIADHGWDHTVWLLGRTGSKKSTLAALGMAHWGERFDFSRLPQSWQSTANSIEKALYLAGWALMVIDNYIPPQTPRETSEMVGKAGRILQMIGDRQARGRLRSDTTERSRYRPRCSVIATGEILPPENESTLGRCVIVPLKEDTVDLEKVRKIRKSRGLLRSAMAGYVKWLVRKFEDRAKVVLEDVDMHHQHILKWGLDAHPRTGRSVAWHASAWDRWLEFGVEVGALEKSDAERVFDEVYVALKALLSAQPRPVYRQAWQKWLGALRTMLRTGVVELAPYPEASLIPADETGKRSTLIGWLAGEEVLIEPMAAYREVTRWIGSDWRATQTELHEQFREAVVQIDGAKVRVLKKTDGKNICPKRTVAGTRERVLVLDRRILGNETFTGLRAVEKEEEEEAFDV